MLPLDFLTEHRCFTHSVYIWWYTAVKFLKSRWLIMSLLLVQYLITSVSFATLSTFRLPSIGFFSSSSLSNFSHQIVSRLRKNGPSWNQRWLNCWAKRMYQELNGRISSGNVTCNAIMTGTMTAMGTVVVIGITILFSQRSCSDMWLPFVILLW